MCKKISHSGGCWISRIQVENLTRGIQGGLRPPSELYLVAKFMNLPGKIKNLGANIFWKP